MQRTQPHISVIAIVSIILFGLFSGCERDLDDIKEQNSRTIYDTESTSPLVAFISDAKDYKNQSYQSHIRKAATYAKLPYAQLDKEDFNNELLIDPSTRVLVITNTKGFNNKAFERIVSFVANGGTLFLPTITTNNEYAFLAGLIPTTNFTSDPKASGYSFQTNVLPGLQGTRFDDDNQHGALLRENFRDDIQILATAATNSEIPMIFQRPLGKGNVIAINSNQDGKKEDRGLYFAAILSGLEHVPYPIANVSTIFIDDFPAPTYETVRLPISTEFNLSETAFYHDVWWPDMQRLAKEENLVYTAAACFDYRNLDTPPFLFSEWDKSMVKKDGTLKVSGDVAVSNVLRAGDEFGLHGYNHISLVEDEWDNPDFMETALLAVQKKWKASNFGALPKTYVPPSNRIDSLGFAALQSGMPSVIYNSSLYLGTFKEGGNREFDTEPYNDHFFNFPRISSGYVVDENIQFDLQSHYLYTGIWSHFIHPDDVYQIPNPVNISSRGNYAYRNSEGLRWKATYNGKQGMFPAFSTFLKRIRKQYPMMRSLKAQDAASYTKEWRYTEYTHTQENAVYNVGSIEETDQEEFFWFSYSRSNNNATFEAMLKNEGYTFTKTPFLEGNLYNITTSVPSIRSVLPRKQEITPSLQIILIENLMKDYEKYLNRVPIFKDIDEEVAYLISQGNIQEAITLLESKIASASIISKEDYITLYQYYGWQGAQEGFYEFLEQQYAKGQPGQLIVISKIIGDANDYPNDVIKKTWMRRQMVVYPNDSLLKARYDSYFSTPQEITESNNRALEEAFLTASTIKEKAALLTELLAADSAIATVFINDLEPCVDIEVQNIAHLIAQALADQGNYAKAIAWSACTDKIAAKTQQEWLLNTGNYERLKTEDFKAYISYLIIEKPALIPVELIDSKPCSLDLTPEEIAVVAYAFANQSSYRTAYNWSTCDDNFKVSEQLQWLAAIKAIEEMELVFTSYISKNPEDNALILNMATRYSELGEITKAWKLASTLPDYEIAAALRKQLNVDVLYITPAQQRDLLDNYSTFFYSETIDTLSKQLRTTTNDFITSSSNVLADRLEPTSISNRIGYGHYDTRGNKHVFGITQNRPFELQLTTQQPANTPISLFGAYYSLTSKSKYLKPTYTGELGIEVSDTGSLFYHAEAGISYSKDSLFSSAQLSFQPAITAPAYNLDIYRAQLSVYEEYKINKNWQLVGALEGNYYTDGVVDGLLNSSLRYQYSFSKKNMLIPYIEGAGMLGTADNRLGFPYWTIKERLYGGAGLAYSYGYAPQGLSVRMDAAQFFDTFSDSFQRYRANVSAPLYGSLLINFNAEFYTLENFYSNNFTLGMTYYFKNKKN